MELLQIIDNQTTIIQQQASTIRKLAYELTQIRAVYGLKEEKKVEHGRGIDYNH